jgi:hypothetical protein
MVYSFPYRDISLPLLNLFQNIFFEAIVNGIIFLYSFSVYSLLVYRKDIDFCKLILYAATLLKGFMMSGIFLLLLFGGVFQVFQI